jgi:hypothetical protein
VVFGGVFFGFLNVLHTRKKGLSSPFYTVLGVYSIFYIIIGIIWMPLYSLLISGLIPEEIIPYWWLKSIYRFLQSYPVPLKIYVAILVMLTLLWVILVVITMQIDSNYKQTTDKLKVEGNTLNFYTQKIALLTSRYEKICLEKRIKYETDSNNRTILDRLKGKISFLTPNVFRSETFISQLNTMLEKCEDIVEETATASEEQLPELNKKMQRFVNNSIEELNMLKNMTRK